MEIIIKDQAVLNLILKYHDNPDEISLESTLEQIREYWPETRTARIQYWGIWNLTPASLKNLLEKYFPEIILKENVAYALVVNCKTLSMEYVTMSEYVQLMNKTMMLWQF